MATVAPFLWIGNHPATDLCNTQPVIGGELVELLPDIDAVAEWATLAGVSAVDVGGFTPHDQRSTMAFVRRLRGALRTLLESGRRDAGGVGPVNDLLGEQPGALTLSLAPEDPVTLTASAPDAQLRLDIAAAVVDIFRYDAGLVRRCANPACVLLFLDVSKSGRRRWCDMATCGNRAKAAAHYARTRSS